MDNADYGVVERLTRLQIGSIAELLTYPKHPMILDNLAMLPFPHPAHRTGRADLPHPALGEDSGNRLSHCL
jgi:hypothetical protein